MVLSRCFAIGIFLDVARIKLRIFTLAALGIYADIRNIIEASPKSKGPTFKWHFALEDRFSQKAIYFQHTGKRP